MYVGTTYFKPFIEDGDEESHFFPSTTPRYHQYYISSKQEKIFYRKHNHQVDEKDHMPSAFVPFEYPALITNTTLATHYTSNNLESQKQFSEETHTNHRGHANEFEGIPVNQTVDLGIKPPFMNRTGNL